MDRVKLLGSRYAVVSGQTRLGKKRVCVCVCAMSLSRLSCSLFCDAGDTGGLAVKVDIVLLLCWSKGTWAWTMREFMPVMQPKSVRGRREKTRRSPKSTLLIFGRET